MFSMKFLYLFRHGKSSWGDPRLDDHERPLAPRGRRAAKLIAEYLAREDVAPPLVLCSSALRARETLDRISPAFGKDVSFRIEPGLYGADQERLLRRLRRVPERIGSVMLIGHNPALQLLALALAAEEKDRRRLEGKFPTAALATLGIPSASWRQLAPGDAELLSLVIPRDLS
jgi:phosphohistidine phosphatase